MAISTGLQGQPQQREQQLAARGAAAPEPECEGIFDGGGRAPRRGGERAAGAGVILRGPRGAAGRCKTKNSVKIKKKLDQTRLTAILRKTCG